MSNITKLTPKREPVALELIDEIRSYMTVPSRPYEPGEIDVIALRDEYEDDRNNYDLQDVWDALEPYIETGDRNPLATLPTTTPSYTKVVAFVKQFEVGEW